MDHEPQPVLGRYRFVRRLAAGPRTVVWIAHDEETGRDMVASLLPATRATALEPIVGMSHPHMAQVIEVINEWDPAEIPGGEAPHPDGSIVVADYITGRSLHQRAQSGPIDAIKAVQWVERGADVLSTVHRLGGVHGAVSPRSILVSQTTHGVAPVLTHLTAAPAGAYCSPERVTGGGPSEADDVWALTATLYLALTGKPPFMGADRKALARAILAATPATPDGLDGDLLELLGRGLRRSLPARLHTAEEFHECLLSWLDARSVEHRESVITVMPPAQESDRPSMVDDRAMQDAITKPEAPEASLPTSVAPPAQEPPPRSARVADDAAGEGVDSSASPTRASSPAGLAAKGEADHAAPPASHGAAGGAAGAGGSEGRTGTYAPAGRSTHPTRPDAKDKGRGAGAKLAVLAVVLGGAALVYLGTRSEPPPPSPSTSRGAPGPEAPPAPAPDEPSAGASRARQTAHADADAGSERDVRGATAVAGSRPGSDPTECLVAALPEGTFGKAPSLDYVCERTDYWYIARRTFARISKKGDGDGMREWVHLTRYELPAVAMLRRRCCPGAEPASAETPRTSCEPLTAVLADIAKAPTDANVARFEETFECLQERQVRYPPAWDRLPASQSREYFDRLRNRLKR